MQVRKSPKQMLVEWKEKKRIMRARMQNGEVGSLMNEVPSMNHVRKRVKDK
jgi:hypothetical protein